MLARLGRYDEPQPGLHQRGQVVGVYGVLPAPAAALLHGKAGVVEPTLFEKLGRAVRPAAPHQRRQCIDGDAKIILDCVTWSCSGFHRNGLPREFIAIAVQIPQERKSSVAAAAYGVRPPAIGRAAAPLSHPLITGGHAMST